MDKKDAIAKSFDFASELIKQLLTLAIGIITVTATAVGFFLEGSVPGGINWMLYSWVALSLSVGFGILALMALTGNLVKPNNPDGSNVPTVYNPATQLFVMLQLVSFFLGVVFFLFLAIAQYTCGSSPVNFICRLLL